MNSSEATLAGTVEQALWNASLLLTKAPDLALEQTGEILRTDPAHLGAMLLASRAHRACDEPDHAEALALRALGLRAAYGPALRELGLITLMRNDLAKATEFLENALAANSDDAGAWSVLADVRRLSGDRSGAEAAVRSSILAAVRDVESLAPGAALMDERLSDAEHLLRLRLRDYPTDVSTIRMMAELATRLGRLNDAEKLLRRALEIAPFFQAARELLARNLQRAHRPADALVEIETLLSHDAENPSFQMLKAALLVKIGDQEAARLVYEKVLAAHPNQPKGWMSLGHVLKTLGRRDAGISAYKRAIRELPTLGEAWWSLANLKTVRFTPDDIAEMERALRQGVNDDDNLHLHFALGKASEDAGDYRSAFEHWSQGNALRRKTLDYDPSEIQESCARAKAFFDKAVLGRKSGHAAHDPIFIVGMPRSGSTLVEQILASHSQIEGTMELPDMMEIASRLSHKAKQANQRFPEMLGTLSTEERVALGQEYLDRTRVHRKTGRPYFIDKMPNNWMHVGLIRTILPNAHIIDTRRHPVGCCLSMWKQHFARGQGFSYDLGNLARYYRDYEDLMTHFATVMPDMVHRVVYERMVADSEHEIRTLLDYLQLPFEEACVSFWRNDRAVRTASSEQVRQPIFTDAVDHWRNFEPWLGSLLRELAPVIETYPHRSREDVH